MLFGVTLICTGVWYMSVPALLVTTENGETKDCATPTPCSSSSSTATVPHFDIGHFSVDNIVFTLVKHPHFLHLPNRVRYGQVLQMVRRWSMVALGAYFDAVNKSSIGIKVFFTIFYL
jgi:hypothetical protein